MNHKEPELHYATDRRCYNGAMCSDLQKEIDSRNSILKEIQNSRPDYRCTYFPMEGKFMSFVDKETTIRSRTGDYVAQVPCELTGNFFEDKGQCLLEAWRILVGGK